MPTSFAHTFALAILVTDAVFFASIAARRLMNGSRPGAKLHPHRFSKRRT